MELSDIHDIKPLENIGIDPMLIRMALYGLGILLILAFLALAFRYWKTRKKKRIEKISAPLLPDEMALLCLEKLSDTENMDGKEFYFEMSLILRNYIRGRFGINAPEMTTEELVPKIEDSDIPKEMHKDLKDLLRSSDPVKFAGVPAIASEMKKALFFALNFVKQTRSRTTTSPTKPDQER